MVTYDFINGYILGSFMVDENWANFQNIDNPYDLYLLAQEDKEKSKFISLFIFDTLDNQKPNKTICAIMSKTCPFASDEKGSKPCSTKCPLGKHWIKDNPNIVKERK